MFNRPNHWLIRVVCTHLTQDGELWNMNIFNKLIDLARKIIEKLDKEIRWGYKSGTDWWHLVYLLKKVWQIFFLLGDVTQTVGRPTIWALFLYDSLPGPGIGGKYWAAICKVLWWCQICSYELSNISNQTLSVINWLGITWKMAVMPEKTCRVTWWDL